MQDLASIRNIGIIAHIDAGKTSTTEGMLFFSGLTHRYGSIDAGSTVMDYLPEERSRGITIVAAAASLPWEEHLIHLIDTPGHIDFTAEVERSLRVIDGAVVIFSGVEGVEAQSEKVWRQADGYAVPKIAFINKLDRVGASFTRVVSEINRKFGGCAVPIQLPIGIEDEFATIIDLVAMERVSFSGADLEQVVRDEIPEALRPDAELGREQLIERLADECDEIAMAYLDGDDISVKVVTSALRGATLSRRLVPVMCGSAKKHLGVQPLMDAVLDYLPSPGDQLDIPAHAIKRDADVVVHPDPAAPFAGLVFKVVASRAADLLYLRTYSGTLKANATLVNSRTGNKIRAKQVLRLYAKSTEAVEQVGPGDIVGVIGPRDCGTGDTVCEPRSLVAFEKIIFPTPVLSVAVEPRMSKDRDKLDDALDLLCREDPTLGRTRDEETGQRIVSGMGELHLEITMKRLLAEFSVDARVGDPRVAYRETVKAASVESVAFHRVLGETELFAETTIAFEPLARGGDMFVVENGLRGRGQAPADLVRAAERSIAEGLRTGGNFGYPLIYVRARLEELLTDPERTTEGAVVGAVLLAVDQVIRKRGTVVLEPLMHLEVLTPDQHVGEISMYLQPRRAVIHEMATTGETKRISCEVPLAEMFGFGKSLPKLSGGRATFSMEPCGYQAIPPEMAEKMFGAL